MVKGVIVLRDISSMRFIESLDINIDTSGERNYQYVNTENYPLDYYWVFSACDESFGNNHILCPVDFKFRIKYKGHCVCGCHR